MIEAREEDIAAFWRRVREQLPDLTPEPPAAWAFGATTAHADELLALVLAGVKTGTASSVRDYEASGEPLPAVDDLSVILDGSAVPRAVLRTVSIEIVPFDQVTPEHAHAEGEGDRTLTAWREIHERYWRAHSENPLGFDRDMPVVCERFELLFP